MRNDFSYLCQSAEQKTCNVKDFFLKKIRQQTTFSNSFSRMKIIVHYSDNIMRMMVSQISSISIVYSTACSSMNIKKKSKLRIIGLCEGNTPVNSSFPTEGPVTLKMLAFDEVIMFTSNLHTVCA